MDRPDLEDFFVAYPDGLAVELFRSLREKKPASSSNILYFIKFYNDPSCEILKNLSNEVRREELKKWLGVEEKDLKLGYVKKCEEWFVDNWLEPTARLLNAHSKKINESAKVVEKYSVDSLESMGDYAEAIDTYQKIKETYDKCVLMFKSQDTIKQKHGGGQLSPASTGKIFEGIQ